MDSNNNEVLKELESQQQQLEEIDQLLVSSPDDPSLLALKADLLELISVTTAQLLPCDDDEPASLDATAGTTTMNSTTTDTTQDTVVENSTEQPDVTNDDAAEMHISGWSNVKSQKAVVAATKRALELDTTTSRETEPAAAAVDDSNFSEETGESSEQQQQQDRCPPPLKKTKKTSKSVAVVVPKEFVIPPHLLPNEQDSTAETNRKKRAVKALKNQWRAQKKELEVNEKQKSWQNFQKKNKTGSASGVSGGGGGASESMFSTSTGSTKVGVVGGRNLTEFASRKRNK